MIQCMERQDMIASCEFSSNGRFSSSQTMRSIGTVVFYQSHDLNVEMGRGCCTFRLQICVAVKHALYEAKDGGVSRNPRTGTSRGIPEESVMMSF